MMFALIKTIRKEGREGEKEVIFYMPEKKRDKKGREEDIELSEATEKRIDDLPEHAQHIFKKAHSSAVKEYKDPSKRRGGANEDVEEVAHKVAWAAVKKDYKKSGDKWVKK